MRDSRHVTHAEGQARRRRRRARRGGPVPAGRVHEAPCVSRSCGSKAQPRAAGRPGTVAAGPRSVAATRQAAPFPPGPPPPWPLPGGPWLAAVTAVTAPLSHGVLPPSRHLCPSAPNCPLVLRTQLLGPSPLRPVQPYLTRPYFHVRSRSQESGRGHASRARSSTPGDSSEAPGRGLTAPGLSPDACRLTQQPEGFSCFSSVLHTPGESQHVSKDRRHAPEPRKGWCDSPRARHRQSSANAQQLD